MIKADKGDNRSVFSYSHKINKDRHPEILAEIKSINQMRIDSKAALALFRKYDCNAEDWKKVKDIWNMKLRYIYGNRNKPLSKYMYTYMDISWDFFHVFFEWYVSHENWRDKELVFGLSSPGNRYLGPKTCNMVNKRMKIKAIEDWRIIPRISEKHKNQDEAEERWRDKKANECLAQANFTNDKEIISLIEKRAEHFQNSPIEDNQWLDYGPFSNA